MIESEAFTPFHNAAGSARREVQEAAASLLWFLSFQPQGLLHCEGHLSQARQPTGMEENDALPRFQSSCVRACAHTHTSEHTDVTVAA